MTIWENQGKPTKIYRCQDLDMMEYMKKQVYF